MSIQQYLDKIKNAVYGREVRGAIHDAIKQTYDDSIENGDTDMEVAYARGGEPTLNDRLDKMDSKSNRVESQLSSKTSRDEVINLVKPKADRSYVDANKRDISTPIGANDITSQLLDAIQNSPGTPLNLLSIPRDKSVTPEKTTFLETSTNLFNINTITEGHLVDASGQLVPNEQYNVSDYISVEPDKHNYIYGFISVSLFDADKQFIERRTVSEDGEVLSVPENCYFIRLNYQPHRDYPERRVNEGNQLLPYEPYYINPKNLGDRSIEFINQTELGKTGFYRIGSHTDFPNINTNDSIITFYSPFYITYGTERYDFVDDVLINITGGALFFDVLYDTVANSFRVVTNNVNERRDIRETELLIMTVNFESSNQREVRSVWFTSKYAVNGEISDGNGGIQNNKTYYFVPENIVGHYEPSDSYGYNDFDYDTTTAQDVYDAFNQLAQQNNGYISPKNLGLDESGTYPVYKYHLKPQQVEVSELNKTLPKIIIVCGIHGSEKSSVFSLYYWIKDICENWQNDSLLEYLRFNFELVIMPIANPYGFNHTGRVNSNGVDINRNFPVGHRPGDPSSNTYGGPEPFSEAESRYIRDMILEHQDAVYFCDYHTNNGTGSEYGDLMWNFLIEGENANKNIDISAKYIVEKMTREYIKRYDQPNNEGYFGYISYAEEKGFSMLYAAHEGIPSSTFECFRKFPSDAEYHNPKAIKACTEYVGNWILTILKQFKQGQ